tara:strand:- start:10 stop:621 length:612 start_codon:yes stop_codon:yes gene_type:complete
MTRSCAIIFSIFILVQPVFGAMTGGGGSSSTGSSSSSSSSSASSSSGASDGAGSSSSSNASNSSNSYSNSGYGNYGSKKDKKKNVFDPFERIYGLIRLEKFAAAHEALKFISVPTPSKQADKYNLLGFTARKSGNLNAAGEYYERALEINPKHIQALEYQGELYLQLGDIDQAKRNLEKINEICWLICKEKKMLKNAIDLALN